MTGNNAGLSLVELIITIAILAIVGVAIGQFIVVGMNSYKHSNEEIGVQQEAQMAMNQMLDVIIDTAGSVNCRVYNAGGDFWLGPSDTTFEKRNIGITGDKYFESGIDERYKDTYSDATGKLVILYNGAGDKKTESSSINPMMPFATPTPAASPVPEDFANRHEYSYEIFWDNAGTIGEEGRLYLARVSKKNTDYPVANGEIDAEGNQVEFDLLAEHVTRFDFDMSQLKSKSVIKITMDLFMGDRTYTTTNNVKLRNPVSINTVSFDGAKEIETKVSDLNVAGNYLLEPGESMQLPEYVIKGKNLGNVECEWTLVSAISGISLSGKTVSAAITARHTGAPGAEGHDARFSVVAKNKTTHEILASSDNVFVDIKRATGVNVFRVNDEGDTIDPSIPLHLGEEFIVESSAFGDFIPSVLEIKSGSSLSRYICSAPGCSGYNLANDIAINGGEWGLIKPDGSTANESVECNFYLTGFGERDIHMRVSNKSELYGKKFRIRAYSRLAADKGYDCPYGELVLTVEGKPNISLDSGIQYGRAFNITGDFKNSGNRFIVVVRVGDTEGDYDNQSVYFFMPEGNNTVINLDMFGLDWSKEHYYTVQLLKPKGNGSQFNGMSESQIMSTIAANAQRDYANNNNFTKGSGYVPTSYFDTSSVKTGYVPKPTLKVKNPSTGVTYVNEGYELEPVEISSSNYPARRYLFQQTDSGLDIDGFLQTSGDCDNIKYKVYKDGNLIADSVETGRMNVTTYNNIKFDQFDAGGSVCRAEINVIPNTITAKDIGEYKVVPWLYYQNNFNGDHADLVNRILWKELKHTENFSIQKIEIPEAAISVKIGDMNLSDCWLAQDGIAHKVKLYFPTPYMETEFNKYFSKTASGLQECKIKKPTIGVIDQDTGECFDVDFGRATCKFDSSTGKYTLKLYYTCFDTAWNTDVIVKAGVFECDANSKKWTKVEEGSYEYELQHDMAIETCGNAEFDYIKLEADGTCNHYGSAILPAPYEDTFKSLTSSDKPVSFLAKIDDVWARELPPELIEDQYMLKSKYNDYPGCLWIRLWSASQNKFVNNVILRWDEDEDMYIQVYHAK